MDSSTNNDIRFNQSDIDGDAAMAVAIDRSVVKATRGRGGKRAAPATAGARRQSLRQASKQQQARSSGSGNNGDASVNKKARSSVPSNKVVKRERRPKKKPQSSEDELEDDDDELDADGQLGGLAAMAEMMGDSEDSDSEDDWSVMDDEDASEGEGEGGQARLVAGMFARVTGQPHALFTDDEHERQRDVYDFDQQSSIVSTNAAVAVRNKKWASQTQSRLKASLKQEAAHSNASWGSNIYSYLTTFLNTREELDLYSAFLRCRHANRALDHTIAELCKPFRNASVDGPPAALHNLMAKIGDNRAVIALMKDVMSERFDNAAHRISHLVLLVRHPVNGLHFYPKFLDILHAIDSKIVSESGFIIDADKSESSSRRTAPDIDTIVVTDSFHAHIHDRILGPAPCGLQRIVLGVDELKCPVGIFVLDCWNRAGVPFTRARIKHESSPRTTDALSDPIDGLESITNDPEPFKLAASPSKTEFASQIEFVDAFFVKMGGKKDALHLVAKVESRFQVFSVVSESAFAFKKHGLCPRTPILLDGTHSTFSEVLGEEKACLVIPDQFYRSLVKTVSREVHLPNCRFKKFVLLDKQTRSPLGVFFDTDVTLDIQIHERILSEQQLAILAHGQDLKPTKQNVMLGSLNGILVGFEMTSQRNITKCYEIISDSRARFNPQLDKRQSIETMYLAPSGMSTTVQFCNAETGENTFVSASLFENVPYCKRHEQIEDFLNELADRIFDLPVQVSLLDAILRLYQRPGESRESRDDCCVFCGREFKASANVYDHEIRHVGLIRFKCHKHQMVFADVKTYKTHRDEFVDCDSESETEQLDITHKLLNISASISDCPQCDKCYDYFPQQDVLRAHLELCDGVSFNARTPLDSKYDPGESLALTAECLVCGLCGLNYSKLDILCSHMNNHLSCNVCKTRLGSIEEVSAHLRDHVARNESVSGPGKRKILSCDICGDFYGTKINYYYHQWNEHGVVHPPIKAAGAEDPAGADPVFKRRSKRVSELSYMATGMKKFPCKFCGAEVKVAGRDYIKHLDVKHGLAVELDTLCRICADIFETPERLSEHLRDRHLRSGQYINAGIQSIFSCDKCSFFGHFRGVVAHSTAVHADPAPCLYECPHCPDRMADRRLWRIHLEKHDDSQLSWNCEECQTYFRSEPALRLHFETFHGLKADDPPPPGPPGPPGADQHAFACFLCPEKFSFENELHAHQETHSGVAQCDICHKLCKSIKAFELHRIKHFRTRIFQCTECQATFRSKLAMRRHIRVDHLNLEPERYECQICGKIVTQISMHMLIHKNARYQCEYCGKRFTKSAYYNEHVRIHKGEKPYECHICQRRFNKKSNLNVHINFHEKHRDDFGNYLEIKPRGRGHPDYDPQKTIARKNAQKKVDASCGPDPDVALEHARLHSVGCDTSDLDSFVQFGLPPLVPVPVPVEVAVKKQKI